MNSTWLMITLIEYYLICVTHIVSTYFCEYFIYNHLNINCHDMFMLTITWIWLDMNYLCFKHQIQHMTSKRTSWTWTQKAFSESFYEIIITESMSELILNMKISWNWTWTWTWSRMWTHTFNLNHMILRYSLKYIR